MYISSKDTHITYFSVHLNINGFNSKCRHWTLGPKSELFPYNTCDGEQHNLLYLHEHCVPFPEYVRKFMTGFI